MLGHILIIFPNLTIKGKTLQLSKQKKQKQNIPHWHQSSLIQQQKLEKSKIHIYRLSRQKDQNSQILFPVKRLFIFPIKKEFGKCVTQLFQLRKILRRELKQNKPMSTDVGEIKRTGNSDEQCLAVPLVLPNIYVFCLCKSKWSA